MGTIKVSDHCKNAISKQDAIKISELIESFVQNGDDVEVDFSDVTKFVTLFFNNCIGYIILKYTPETYDKLVTVSNLSDLGNDVYRFSYENAKKTFYEKNNTSISDEIARICRENIEGV